MLRKEHIWFNYAQFVQKAIESHDSQEKAKDFKRWQEDLFTNVIIYSIPVSFLALIPSIIIVVNQGHYYIPIFDLLTLISIVGVTLNKRFSLAFRKGFVVVMFYLLAIFLTAALGSFGIGAIYVLSTSVFIALHFKNRVAYGSIFINFLIYAAFAIVIYFKLFHLTALNQYNFGLWIGFSLNLIFLNLTVIVQIRQVINGFEATVIKEAKALKMLKAELSEKKELNQLLKESEGHYKSLFNNNPSPMWIYDGDTLQFLQVNYAAIKKYGYTAKEFSKMTIKNLRHNEELEELYSILSKNKKSNTSQCITRHRRKDGEQFFVDVRCSVIPFKGKTARLVIARNVTSQINYTQAIKSQNEQLQRIAFIQSHVVRAPLARIMGLSGLIKMDKNHDSQLIDYLDTSVKELDETITEIIKSTAEINSTIEVTENTLDEYPFEVDV